MSLNPFIIPTHPDNTPSPPTPAGALRDAYKVYPKTVPSSPDDKYVIRRSATTSLNTTSMTALSNNTLGTTTLLDSGSINYSPKHSRKPASLGGNRNMKNLSLNFSYPNASPSSNYTTTLLSPASDMPFNKPALSRRKTLTLSIPSNETTTVLQAPPPRHDDLVTPHLTNTPVAPPYISRQKARTVPALSSDTPLLDPVPQPTGKDNYSFFDYSSSATPNIPAPEYSREKFTKYELLSPMIYNGKFSPSSPTKGIRTPEKDLLSPKRSHSKELSPPENLQSPQYNTTLTGSPNVYHNSLPKQQIASARNFFLPEELQESNQLDAYPNGPRNVLNNNIFLYSDPALNPDTKKPRDPDIDINSFDLVINVAKECQDLSSQFYNQVPGVKEYLFVPWSHTSSISRDLPSITSKIAEFDNKGLRILVHCQCGVSRSACVIVAYFMQKFNIGVNEAYELLKSGTGSSAEVNQLIGQQGYNIDACDRICPNMSLIFELMEFGDHLTNK